MLAKFLEGERELVTMCECDPGESDWGRSEQCDEGMCKLGRWKLGMFLLKIFAGGEEGGHWGCRRVVTSPHVV